jgi:hypothetical protein
MARHNEPQSATASLGRPRPSHDPPRPGHGQTTSQARPNHGRTSWPPLEPRPPQPPNYRHRRLAAATNPYTTPPPHKSAPLRAAPGSGHGVTGSGVERTSGHRRPSSVTSAAVGAQPSEGATATGQDPSPPPPSLARRRHRTNATTLSCPSPPA